MIRSRTTIGRYCSIGRRCTLNAAKHPTNWVSSHPLFFSESENSYARPFPEEQAELIIGNDVWIGDNAVIMGEITIGDGAIIGAGAVVTKNVAPYEIVGGVPAKHIRSRFAPEIVEKFLALKWWEYDEDFVVALPHDDVEAAIKMLQARLSLIETDRVLRPHHREYGMAMNVLPFSSATQHDGLEVARFR